MKRRFAFRRPDDAGAPYDDYFHRLNQELLHNGPSHPCLLIDLDRLDANIDVVKRSVRAPKSLRVVAKSLPSLPLIEYVCRRSGAERLMAFHQPFLNIEAEAFPEFDILLGKPMPARAAAHYYRDLKSPAASIRQPQWLIDTHERLEQYLAVARELGLRLRINIELDVGLHRGGLSDHGSLRTLLTTIAAHPQFLEFTGFMGYDPHVVKLPRVLGSREELFAKVIAAYQGFVDCARAAFPALWHDGLTLNGAGSPTYRLYENNNLLNDISVGSAFVKPTDFDLDILEAHQPAAFIATPVLKKSAGTLLPGMEKLPDLGSWWDPNRRQSFFLYGGHWMAKYESPRGLRANKLFGYSSNQEIVNGSPSVGLEVDDHVFFRPSQSEAVLLQFGDLLTVRGGKLQDRWPVLRA